MADPSTPSFSLRSLVKRVASRAVRASSLLRGRLPEGVVRALDELPGLIDELSSEQVSHLGSLMSDLSTRSLPAAQEAARPLLRMVREGQPAVADAYREILVMSLGQDRGAGVLVARDLWARITPLDPPGRLRFLRHVVVATRVHYSLGLALSEQLTQLLPTMEDQALGEYIRQGLSGWRDNPDRAASYLRGESRRGQVQVEALRRSLPFSEVKRVLQFYAEAHGGSSVRVKPMVEAPVADRGEGKRPITVGIHIYLPDEIAQGIDREEDFLIYKVMTALEVGRLEMGTFQLDLGSLQLPMGWATRGDGLAGFLDAAPEQALTRDLFQVLEGYRVEQAMRRLYPGLARDLTHVRGLEVLSRPELESVPVPAALMELLAQELLMGGKRRIPPEHLQQRLDRLLELARPLGEEGARVEDTARVVMAAYEVVASLLERRAPPKNADDSRGIPSEQPKPGESPRQSDQEPGGYEPMSPLDSQGTMRPEQVEQMQGEGATDAEAVAGDVIPPAGSNNDSEELGEEETDEEGEGTGGDGDQVMEVPAAPGDAPPRDSRRSSEGDVAEVGSKIFTYPEWDHHIEDYKNNWTSVWETRAEREDPEFVARTLATHGGVVGRMRRQFERLRREELLRLRRQPFGDDIDIDAVVEHEVDRRARQTPSEDIYVQRRRYGRDVSVAFLLDLSSSTQQMVHNQRSILDIEKEALLLMAEALERLGDSYAVYSFSGYGRRKVSFYVAKDFTDRWTPQIQARVGGLTSRLENRDGAAIRHATHRLLLQPSRSRLLILLSDGRPLDCGCQQYFDRYAQEDTRAALTEARRAGVHPFCITVDREASRYLDRMYGQVHYTIIDRVQDLPEKLPRIYRRLTT